MHQMYRKMCEDQDINIRCRCQEAADQGGCGHREGKLWYSSRVRFVMVSQEARGFGHIADVPGLVREAGDLLSVFGIPEDETIERSVLFQPAAFSCCGKPFGELHMDGRTGDIQSKSALMLARTWLWQQKGFPVKSSFCRW